MAPPCIYWLLAATGIAGELHAHCDVDRSQLPEVTAAYYLNRNRDVERQEFMMRTLRKAAVKPVRVQAIEPAVPKLRELLEDPRYAQTNLVRMLRSQKRCTAVVSRGERRGRRSQKASLMNCLSSILRNPLGCFHVTAYATNMTGVLESTSLSPSVCARLLANYMGWMYMLRKLTNDIISGGADALPSQQNVTQRPSSQLERYYMLMEDDTMVLPDYRWRLCRFLRKYPPHTWDIAKVDVDADHSSPRMHHFNLQRKRNAYTPEELAELRADPDAWRKNRRVDSARVPFAYGMGAVLVRESTVQVLLDMVEGEAPYLVDIQVARWATARTLRVAVSEEKLCDPDSQMQKATTLGSRKAKPT